ncbi:MAG: hypothetical protein K5773_04695 [Pseudobutyrivibrio sp.]|nr:hypothetical protein [Pseudobutyrivibrio sp.]
MPFINSKVSVKMTEAQEVELKTRLGQAIAVIPGKSEDWLMTSFEDNCHLYFKGDNSEPMAFVDVRIYGGEDSAAFAKMSGEICKIFGDVLGIKADHIYITYMPYRNWGWNGDNF